MFYCDPEQQILVTARASGSRGIPEDKPFIFNLFLLKTELCNVSPEAIS
jgi:hypothetical protein